MIGHHDALFRLRHSEELDEFLSGSESGHVDLVRTQENSIFASFFACWVENPDDEEETHPEPIDPDDAVAATGEMVGLLKELEEQSEGELLIAREFNDLLDCEEDDTHAAILHFEGAEALGEDLEHLDAFYESGLRSLGLVWSRANAFGHGVPFLFPSSPDTGPGLTARGRDLVKVCNGLGIMLDLSHLNEAGFWDVARLSSAPLVATHSNAHALCPSARNLTDEQLRAVADSGGLVGINFCCSDLRDDGEDDPDTDSDLILEHLEYVAELIGIDHVALGTDFDGSVVPSSVEGVESIPGFLLQLQERGWSDEELVKLCSGNWLRVLKETWLN